MSRFLKIVCAAFVACSVFSAIPAAVQASHGYIPQVSLQDNYRQFNLYIGSCPHSVEFYGVYDSLYEVQEVARQMQLQGYIVRIEAL